MKENRVTKLITNTSLVALGTISSRAITLLLLPIITRVLSDYEYGQVDFFLVTINLLVPFFYVQIGDSLFRFLMDKKMQDKKTAIISNSLFVVFIEVIVLIGIFYIARDWTLLFDSALYFIGAIMLNSLMRILREYCKATDKMKIFVVSDIAYSVVFAVLAILFTVQFERGIYGYFDAYIIACVISIVIVLLFTDFVKNISIKAIEFRLLKRMLSYSLPLISNAMSWWIMNVSDKYLIIYFLGFASNGIYAVSYRMMLIITIVVEVFIQTWRISALNEYHSEDKNSFYSKVFTVMSAGLMAGIIAISPFLKLLVKLFAGEAFFSAWLYTPLLFLGALFSAFSGFYGIGYLISKKTMGALKTTLIGGAINIILNLIFIPFIGVWAAAMSTTVTFFALWIIRIYDCKTYLIIEFNKLKMAANISITAVALMANYMQNYAYVVQILCAISYVVINKNMIKGILKKLKSNV